MSGTIFRTALGLQLRSRRTWALLLLLPLLTAAVLGLLPPEEASAPVRVGVALPDEGAEEFWERLEARNGAVATFIRAGEAEVERQVAAGRWDCGILLPEDFAQRLEALDTRRIFTLLVGPGSTVYPLVRESVAAGLAECVAPGIAAEYLLESAIAGEDDLFTVSSRLEEVLPDSRRVIVSMEAADGRPLDALSLAGAGVSELLAGLVAILLQIWTIFTAMDLGRWLQSPFAGRLRPLRGTSALLLPRMAASLLPAAVSGALALLPLPDPAGRILALPPYLALLGALAAALARREALWGALPALLPFVPPLCLLLSPVLLDISLLSPRLGALARWTPVTLYLRAGGGEWEAALTLAAAASLLLILPVLADMGRSGRKHGMSGAKST